MKKRIMILFCLLLLVGCSKPATQSQEIAFQAGIYPSKFWALEKIEDAPYCVIPNMETAVSVATEIFLNIPKSSKAQAFEAQSVFFDEEDEVWIVLFREEYMESGPDFTGPCYAIALQKKDGKVLSIQVG